MNNPLKYKRKQFITMIELLISLVLTSLMLSLLFYFFRDINFVSQEMEKAQKELFKISYLQNRLNDVLPSIVSPRTTQKDFFFFTSTETQDLIKQGSPSLVFTYNFGANRNPLFANHVLGRLYLDTNDNLTLATWPSPSLWNNQTTIPIKKEVLLQNVESFQLSFYVPPEKDRGLFFKNVPKGLLAKNKLEPAKLIYDHWYNEWKNEYNQLPAIIKISLILKNRQEPLLFITPLPLSDFIIIYDNE